MKIMNPTIQIDVDDLPGGVTMGWLIHEALKPPHDRTDPAILDLKEATNGHYSRSILTTKENLSHDLMLGRGIRLEPSGKQHEVWMATSVSCHASSLGRTQDIAVNRCFLKMVFGPSVAVPIPMLLDDQKAVFSKLVDFKRSEEDESGEAYRERLEILMSSAKKTLNLFGVT